MTPDARRWHSWFRTHRPLGDISGSAWEPTPWQAVQWAAWGHAHQGAGVMTTPYRYVTALWLVCALLLAGCTTHGRVGALPTLPDPEQAAEIVVIREWRFIGGGGNFTVVLDGVPVYGIAVDEHVVLRVAPGDHVVTITRRGPFLNDAAAAVRAEPRRRYYYRLETSTWSSDITLLPVAPSAGEQLAPKTRRVQ